MKHLVTAFLLILAAPVVSAADAIKVGQSMPQLSKLLPGSSLPSTSGKVVLVDFWASWCGPCLKSFPALNKLHAKYVSKGLVIIGIGVDDDAAKHKSFMAKLKPSFSVAHDSSHKAAGFFNPATMPSSYLVDRKGVIRYLHTGFHGAKTEAEYTTEIEALLSQGQ